MLGLLQTIVSQTSSSGGVPVDGGTAFTYVVPTIPPGGINDDMVTQLIGIFVQSFEHKNYIPAVATGIMLIVFFFNKYLIPKLSEDPKVKNYLPYIGMALGILGAIGAALLNPAGDMASKIVQGIVSAITAAGMWTVIGRHLLSGFLDPTKPVNQSDPMITKDVEKKV